MAPPVAVRRQPRWQQRQTRLGHALALWRRLGRHLLRCRCGLLCKLHEGGCGPDRAAGPENRACAGHDRIAAERRGPALGHRAVSRSSVTTTSGGATSRGGQTLLGPSSVAIANSPKCRGRCNAACWAAPSRPGTSRASRSWDEVGELVCTQPMPSMPHTFGATPTASATCPATSTCTPWPRVWRHGDWLKVNAQTAAASSMAAAMPPSTATACAWAPASSTARSKPCPRCWTRWWSTWNTWAVKAICRCLWCCAMARAGRCDARQTQRCAIQDRTVTALCAQRHFQVAEIPRTLSGKKQELPIKKLLLGQPMEKVVNKEAMANPGCLDWYVAF
jgi:hypothetical protein